MVFANQIKDYNIEDKSLLSLLRNMNDFRRNEGKIHDLETIIMIVLMALMSGFNNYSAFFDFSQKKKKEIIKYLKPRKKKLPSYDTIRRIFLNLDFEELSYVFKTWATQFIKFDEQNWISFDGKAIKGTLPEESNKLIQIITFFAHKSKMVITHGKVNYKQNEIPLVQKLLQEMKLENQVLMADALHTQKKTIGLIVDSGNYYVLNVKGNQKKLLKKVKFLVEEVKCPKDFHQTTEKSRGRYEVRKAEVFENDFQRDLSNLGFKECKYIIKISREVLFKGNKSNEIAYFISNLDATASEFNRGIRNHWLIESMHWIKDIVFKEDNSLIRKGNAPQNLTILRDFVLNTLRHNGFESITHSIRMLGCEIKTLVSLLGGSY